MNTTTIIRQIKEYMGAYGKAYTLLYLIGAVTILTSCVKDDLYDTPHPDRGAVVVTTDWSGKSTEADIPQAYTLRIGGREQNVSAATNVFDALLAPGGYGLTVYNSPEGISIDGNKATVNPVDLTGASSASNTLVTALTFCSLPPMRRVYACGMSASSLFPLQSVVTTTAPRSGCGVS